MSVSVPDFWRLVAESQLLPPHDCQRLGQQFGGVKGAADQGNARTLSEWLVSQNVISRYQSTVLLGGRAGPFIYGEYKIYDRIAAGPLTGGFKAVHMLTGQNVLLQFLPGELFADQAVWARTATHAQKHCAVKNPHLSRCFELVDLVQYKFLVVEDPAGHSTADLLTSQGKLPHQQAAGLVRQAALGLGALHGAGLVHGDIHPARLFRAGDGRGLLWREALAPPTSLHEAKPDRTLLTRADYLAPEMAAQGKQPDAAVDVYALGATLYHLLSGQPPFAGGDVNQKMQRHASEAIQPLAQHGVPEPLAQAVAYMMAKNPSVRYPDTGVVAQQLAPFVSNEDLQPRAVDPRVATFDDHLQRKHEALKAQSPSAAAAIVAPVTTQPATSDNPFTGIDTTGTSGGAATATRVAGDVAAATGVAAATTAAATAASATPSGESASARFQKKQPIHKNMPLMVTAGAAAAFLLLFGVLWATGAFDGSGEDDTKVAKKEEGKEGGSNGDGNNPDNGGGTTRENGGSDGGTNGGTPDGNGGNPPTPGDRYNVDRQDDGVTLWAPPVAGEPIDTAFVPSDVRVMLIARPKAMLETPNGQQVLRSLMGNPSFARLRQQWETATGVTVNEVEQVIISLHSNDSRMPRATSTVHLAAATDLKSRWGNPSTVGNENVFNVKGKTAWIPPAGGGRVFVIGDAADVTPLAQSAAERPKPALSKQFTDLLKTSDSQHHVTLLFDPNFLHAEGRPLMAGAYEKLLPPLRAMFDNYTKGMLSLHFGDDFYAELRVYAGLQKRPGQLKTEFESKLAALPNDVKDYILQLDPPKYWRKLWFNFPQMVTIAHQETRLGLENDMTVINVALPGYTAQNLVMATDLAIAGNSGAATTGGGPTTPTKTIPQTIDQLLAAKFTLGFEQQSLEFAMRDLGQDIRDEYPSLPFDFQIKIIGDDLKVDGITRNQQVRDFNSRDVSVSQILTQLVMKANPVTTVTDPSEVDQKLVWVVGPDPDNVGKNIILITTRTASGNKGYTLPGPFQPK